MELRVQKRLQVWCVAYLLQTRRVARDAEDTASYYLSAGLPENTSRGKTPGLSLLIKHCFSSG
jgi:hypothetical protein